MRPSPCLLARFLFSISFCRTWFIHPGHSTAAWCIHFPPHIQNPHSFPVMTVVSSILPLRCHTALCTSMHLVCSLPFPSLRKSWFFHFIVEIHTTHTTHRIFFFSFLKPASILFFISTLLFPSSALPPPPTTPPRFFFSHCIWSSVLVLMGWTWNSRSKQLYIFLSSLSGLTNRLHTLLFFFCPTHFFFYAVYFNRDALRCTFGSAIYARMHD